MIVVEMAGGLANQMVLYAAARALAEKHGTKLKLDIEQLKKDSVGRKYALIHLNITGELATSDDTAAVTRRSQFPLVEKLKNKTRRLLKIRNPHVYEEPHGGYDPNFWSLGDDVYLKGYFISRRYFDNIEAILRKEFQVRSPLSEVTRQYAGRVEQEQSVSIHIRRGDYASDKNTRNFHGLLDLAYYQRAMAAIEAKVADPVYYVFSDDIDWAKENLKASRPLVFVQHVGPDNAYEDMYLMSRCRHNITANSGFSYWGAWLNEHQGKMVVAPERWVANDYFNQQFDLPPPDWLRV